MSGTQNSANTPADQPTRFLRDIVDSGRPLVYICTPEEERVRQLLRTAAESFFATPLPICTWSSTAGMWWNQPEDPTAEAVTPLGVLDYIIAHPEPALFHLQDFHEFMRDSADIRRRLRELYMACFDQNKYVIISSPVKVIPTELEREMAYLTLGMPGLQELSSLLQAEMESFGAAGHTVDSSPSSVAYMARALQGLTLNESRHALRRALAAGQGITAESIPVLLDEKKQLVGRTGAIEYIPVMDGIDAVGGLRTLKHWLMSRRKLFSMHDEISAEIVPKGVLVMGISGCGKSLAIKAISSSFGLPLYRVNMTDIFSDPSGQPEKAFAETCRILEEMAPAVAWFDEIEAGITTNAKSDEAGRLFGFFLTWMQEKTRGLFVGATANRIDLLPAEMIRKGRFDEVFFVDLPTGPERVEIFKVHLQRRGVDPSAFEFERLISFTQGFSGAEVEQCVVSAMTQARIEDRELTDSDLRSKASSFVPLSKTMKEQVEYIRNWAFERAMRATPRDVGF